MIRCVLLWLVIGGTIHPFDDGNGRMARTIMDLFLARADEMPHRFYSMSAEIRKQRKGYYEILEKTQKGSLDITYWLEWFLNCLEAALSSADTALRDIEDLIVKGVLCKTDEGGRSTNYELVV